MAGVTAVPKSASKSNSKITDFFRRRIIVAAVCYRIHADRGLEILLVRTKSGRWTFPKGGVDGDPSWAAAAAREAQEEAGVTSRIQESCFASYLHYKRGYGAQLVHAHLCEVIRVGVSRESYRMPAWFSPEDATTRLREGRARFFADEVQRVVTIASENIAAE